VFSSENEMRAMSVNRLMGLAGIASALLWAPTANALSLCTAGCISIGFQETGVNGGLITPMVADVSGGGPAIVGGTSYGTFFINVVTATGIPNLGTPELLDTTSLNIVAQPGFPFFGVAGTLNVYITEQGLTAPISPVRSSFTTQSGTFTSVTESTYYDSANGQFTTPGGGLLQTVTFTGISSATFLTPLSTSALYSLTEVYQITVPAGGSASSTINLAGPIISRETVTPLPAALPLFATGLGVMGLLARRRKRKNAALAAA
jgi:hypothetical protein